MSQTPDAQPDFQGFPKDSITFLNDLAANNDREWFKARKPRYEDSVLNPARHFVSALGESLREISPDIVADPRVNRSLFRINRDTRFSKDKSPYKTNLAVWFWEGAGKRMECSGYYFHLEADMLLLGAGLYMFPKPVLEAYREAVDDDARGDALAQIVADLNDSGVYTVGGAATKRVPRGYDKNHPRADLLKHKGMHVGVEFRPVPDVVHTEALVEMCVNHYKATAPLHRWFCELVAEAYEED